MYAAILPVNNQISLHQHPHPHHCPVCGTCHQVPVCSALPTLPRPLIAMTDSDYYPIPSHPITSHLERE